MPMSHELHLRCCFCGKDIAEQPRTITVDAEGGGEQRLFAHTACLRDRLDPSVPLGAPGAFGVEFKDHKQRWTLGRVVVLGLILALVLLAPVAILQFVD